MDTNIETAGEDFVFTAEELREPDVIWGDAVRSSPDISRGEGPISGSSAGFEFPGAWARAD